ncbi:hypothetical protein M9458_013152, partial [Cirrhinus mrigala]
RGSVWGPYGAGGSPTQAHTFPSSQLFINCPFFPAEFSIVATVKVSHTKMK